MEHDLDQPLVQRALRTMQVITMALSLGALMFAVVALALVLTGGMQPISATTPVNLTVVAGLMAIVSLPLALLIPKVMAATARRSIASGSFAVPGQLMGDSSAELGEAGKLALAQTPIVITRGAILEGSALFCAVAYLLEQSYISLALAFLLAIVLLLGMPTRARLSAWVEEQRTRLRDDSMLRSRG